MLYLAKWHFFLYNMLNKESFGINMKIWIKEFKDNHLIQDMVVTNNDNDTRTHKVFNALEQACVEFDLSVPMWLDKNIREFKNHSRTKFYNDSFIETVDFDYLDFQVIEED